MSLVVNASNVVFENKMVDFLPEDIYIGTLDKVSDPIERGDKTKLCFGVVVIEGPHKDKYTEAWCPFYTDMGQKTRQREIIETILGRELAENESIDIQNELQGKKVRFLVGEATEREITNEKGEKTKIRRSYIDKFLKLNTGGA